MHFPNRRLLLKVSKPLNSTIFQHIQTLTMIINKTKQKHFWEVKQMTQKQQKHVFKKPPPA